MCGGVQREDVKTQDSRLKTEGTEKIEIPKGDPCRLGAVIAGDRRSYFRALLS